MTVSDGGDYDAGRTSNRFPLGTGFYCFTCDETRQLAGLSACGKIGPLIHRPNLSQTGSGGTG